MRARLRAAHAGVLAALAVVTGCSTDPGPNIVHDAGAADARSNLPPGAPASICTMLSGAGIVCYGSNAIHCNADGTASSYDACGTTTSSVCAPMLGCRTCIPGRGRCSGDMGMVCRADGSGFDPLTTCDPASGTHCDPGTGTCLNLCQEAEASNSYIGCEYWPATMLNGELDPEFQPAVAVANPHTFAAHVTLEHAGAATTSVTVAPHGLETIPLPWVAELKGSFTDERSVLSHGGAYHLRSDVPVTVYQFNPLEYRIPMDCASEGATHDGQCFSYSNDASLLLPVHVLTGRYLVMSWPSLVFRRTRITPPAGTPTWLTHAGYLAVIGVEATPTMVTVRPTAHVRGSVDGVVADIAPGTEATFTLAAGDVLQLVTDTPHTCPDGSPSQRYTVMGNEIEDTFCDMGPSYDLTGSEVRVVGDGRVAVIGGHSCAYVPIDKGACDHLEEQMFPLQAWGKRVIMSATEPLRGEPNIFRVLSGHDGNSVTFEPAAVHAPVTLARGETIQFQSDQDFQVVGSEALLVGQYMVGQDFSGPPGPMASGDPSLSLGIPTDQYRTSYTFLAPTTYDVSYVNIVSPAAESVTLDDTTMVTGWRPIGATGMQTARVMITGGTHTLTSGLPFGIVVYGYGSYTSYMVPGGLDLTEINTVF